MIDNYISVFHKEQEDKLYKTYVTETLRMMTENTARQSNGSYLKARFIDIIDPKEPEEEPDEQEVIADIMEKLRKVH